MGVYVGAARASPFQRVRRNRPALLAQSSLALGTLPLLHPFPSSPLALIPHNPPCSFHLGGDLKTPTVLLGLSCLCAIIQDGWTINTFSEHSMLELQHFPGLGSFAKGCYCVCMLNSSLKIPNRICFSLSLQFAGFLLSVSMGLFLLWFL